MQEDLLRLLALATSVISVKVETIDCLIESHLPLFNGLSCQLNYYKNSRDFLLGEPIVSLTTINDNITYLRHTIRHQWHNPSIL